MSRPGKERSREDLQEDYNKLKELVKYKEGLPHLFAQKFYPWARRVWDSTNPEIYLCSANQVGKSSIAIRKNIRLATDPTLWPKYWPNLLKNQKPNLFWYMLPTAPVAQTEYETKWADYWLPQGEFKDHPQFGWRPEFEKGMISKIKFNTGVTIQFKYFSQKVRDLQTATVYHVTADEELPEEYFPEVKARLNATDGKYLAVFTATLGQRYLQQTLEPSTPSEERAKDALKLQVSLFDSQWFDDGTPSHWTPQKIQRAINNCPTEAEIQRRVYGRFVKATGLLYESFAVGKNMVNPSPIPNGWSIWSGVDVGSGGQSGHPAAIVFVAASEDFKQGRVFRAWRGDGIPTTATDIIDKYRELKKGLTLTHQAYDFASADFYTVASRLGESFVPANKRREAGIGLLNTLFKCGVLAVERDDPELEKLVQELTSLSSTDNKRKVTDDLSDALRYAVMAVPWNFEGLDQTLSIGDALELERKPRPQKTDSDLRRDWSLGLVPETETDLIYDEFDFWNDFSGA
jgi:phage terminase large subunit-like protein